MFIHVFLLKRRQRLTLTQIDQSEVNATQKKLFSRKAQPLAIPNDDNGGICVFVAPCLRDDAGYESEVSD